MCKKISTHRKTNIMATSMFETAPAGTPIEPTNQYMTALTVLAKAGYTRSDNASELSDADKLQAIEIAKTLLTASDDA